MEEKHEVMRILMQKVTKFLVFTSLVFVFFSVSSAATEAASLDFYTSADSYQIGDNFSVRIGVSSADQAMNAVSGIVSFPSDKIEVVSLSKSGSIVSLWVQEPSFSNGGQGAVNFEGIVLNPGFRGTGGRILVINFKARAAGKADLSFSSGSVLANDGKGTNILGSLGSANFDIKSAAIVNPPQGEEIIAPKASRVPLAPEIFSSTHPKQEQWYNNSNSEFSWKITPDILGVSVSLNDSPTGNPGPASDGIFGAKSYENLADGVWYLHLKFKNSFGWGPVSHFKIEIDAAAPKSFAIKFIDGKETDNPCPTILFDTSDSISGIAYYKVKVGEGDFDTFVSSAVKSNPYTLACQDPGKKTILVQAFDQAGNYTIATDEIVIRPIISPVLVDYPKQLRTDETLFIKGMAIPNAEVAVMLAEGSDYSNVKKQTVKRDAKGNFIFVADEKLKEGVYKVWAATRDNRGAASNPSEKISFEVVAPYVIKVGRIAIDYLTVINTLIILIAGVLAIVFYMFYRVQLYRRKVKKETKETKDVVANAFNALRSEVEEQVAMIDGNSRLSKREKKVSDSLKGALKIAEDFIGKEVKDIEDELK